MAGHLFSCFYCFCHWVVFAGIAIYRPVVVISGNTLVDLVVTVFFTVVLAVVCSGIMLQVIRIAIAKASEELDLKINLRINLYACRTHRQEICYRPLARGIRVRFTMLSLNSHPSLSNIVSEFLRSPGICILISFLF